MNNESIVNQLYKFLKTDVTTKSLFEATDSAYKGNEKRVPIDESKKDYIKLIMTGELSEGKLPEDPSLVKDPTGDIQKLSEEKKDKTAGDVKPAEMTDEVAKTKVEKVADKETPDVDKKSDPVKTAKAATKEGKLPADLSQIKNPTEEIYMLAENEVESPLTTVADEEMAKNIVNKVGPGKARSEKNSKGAWVVYTKEAKKDAGVTGVKVEGSKKAKDVLKDQQKSTMKENTTTEMPAVKAAQVPEVSTDGDKTVDVTPIVNANPDNKDKEGIAGEVNADANADKIANANPDNKDGAVIKEDTTTEPTAGEVKPAAKVPEVDAETKTDVDAGAVSNANPDNKDKTTVQGANVSTDPSSKVASANPDNKDKEGLVKEDVAVDVKTNDQTVTVTAGDQGGTTVTTTSVPVDADAPIADEVAPVAVDATEEDMVLPAEELEVAEKLFLVDYLGSKKSLTEKEQKFISEAKSIKLSSESWKRVNKKIAEFKAKK